MQLTTTEVYITEAAAKCHLRAVVGYSRLNNTLGRMCIAQLQLHMLPLLYKSGGHDSLWFFAFPFPSTFWYKQHYNWNW